MAAPSRGLLNVFVTLIAAIEEEQQGRYEERSKTDNENNDVEEDIGPAVFVPNHKVSHTVPEEVEAKEYHRFGSLIAPKG